MDNYLRKLARSYYWQTIYNNKELSSVKLFINSYNLTQLQIAFLGWLGIYKRLYTDLASKENYISIEVIENDLRTDSYLLYLRKYKSKEDQKDKKGDSFESQPSLVFKTKN